MFQNINDYILLSREHRRSHLQLNDRCIEIGGDSTLFRGLLAHHLHTTIPAKQRGQKVLVCHACHNPSCSNPRHLYWGTHKDNVIDSKEAGTWSSHYDRMVLKYGSEKTSQLLSEYGKKARGRSGTKLSEERIEAYKRAIQLHYPKRGWVTRAAKELNVSHTQLRRIVDTYNLVGPPRIELGTK